jgi:hypothetical protein
MLNIVQKQKKPCIVSEGIPRPHLGKRYVCSSRIFIVKTANKVDIKTPAIGQSKGYIRTVCRPAENGLFVFSFTATNICNSAVAFIL